jgi:hypothetical protein
MEYISPLYQVGFVRLEPNPQFCKQNLKYILYLLSHGSELLLVVICSFPTERSRENERGGNEPFFGLMVS